jgi:serine/threonine protein phosphatase PrpC
MEIAVGKTKPLNVRNYNPHRIGRTDELDQNILKGAICPIAKAVIDADKVDLHGRMVAHISKSFGHQNIPIWGAMASNVGGSLKGNGIEGLQTSGKDARNEHNEDAAGALLYMGQGVAFIMDGAGGHDHGELAAQVALQTILKTQERTGEYWPASDLAFRVQASLNALENIFTLTALHAIENRFIEQFPEETADGQLLTYSIGYDMLMRFIRNRFETISQEQTSTQKEYQAEGPDGQVQPYGNGADLLRFNQGMLEFIEVNENGSQILSFIDNPSEHDIKYFIEAYKALKGMDVKQILAEVDRLQSDIPPRELENAIYKQFGEVHTYIDSFQSDAVKQGLFSILTGTSGVQANSDTDKLFSSYQNAEMLKDLSGHIYRGFGKYRYHEQAAGIKAAGSICVFEGDQLSIAQVGDTRVYKLAEELVQLTADDSPGGRLMQTYLNNPADPAVTEFVRKLMNGSAGRAAMGTFIGQLGFYFRSQPRFSQVKEDAPFAHFQMLVHEAAPFLFPENPSAAPVFEYNGLTRDVMVDLACKSQGSGIYTCFGGKYIGNTGGIADVPVTETTFLPGEILLLCSDGLTDAVQDSEIEIQLKLVQTNQISPEEAANNLILRARELATSDNVTAVILYKKQFA